jgi:hypothetical protein
MEDDDEEIQEDGHVDDLGQVLQVEHSDCGNDKEKAKLQRMIEDDIKLLYPDWKQRYKKLSTSLEMFQWKAKHGVCDKGI